MRVEAQETTYVWHDWHEQHWGILMVFREERVLPGQLKLIVWFTNPVGLHWLQTTAGSREPVMCKEMHAPTQCFTLTVSTSQPRRRNLRSTSTELQTGFGSRVFTWGGRVMLKLLDGLLDEPPWLPELDASVLAAIWSQSRSVIEKYKVTDIRIFEADSLSNKEKEDGFLPTYCMNSKWKGRIAEKQPLLLLFESYLYPKWSRGTAKTRNSGTTDWRSSSIHSNVCLTVYELLVVSS